MPSEDNFSVYIHINKVNGKKYVGITKQNPERRWQKGEGYAKTYFGNAIKKYGWDNFTHDVVMSGLSREEASNAEKVLIKQYNSNQREFGYNISEGGYTCDCIGHLYGENHPNHQRVKMIDKETGAVLKIFGSQSDAARELGICRKGITKACQGKGTASYKGYYWEYADKEYEKPEHPGVGNYDHKKHYKKVRLVCPDGKELIFDSVKFAAEYAGLQPFIISRYITGSRVDKTGRRWSHA